MDKLRALKRKRVTYMSIQGEGTECALPLSFRPSAHADRLYLALPPHAERPPERRRWGSRECGRARRPSPRTARACARHGPPPIDGGLPAEGELGPFAGHDREEVPLRGTKGLQATSKARSSLGVCPT